MSPGLEKSTEEKRGCRVWRWENIALSSVRVRHLATGTEARAQADGRTRLEGRGAEEDRRPTMDELEELAFEKLERKLELKEERGTL